MLFSYLAPLTQRLEFVTGILILPQRQTALVAKQAATLDVLCGGRLRLGIGNGWNEVEYTALGENFRNRGRRIEEQVALLRRLWTEPLVTFEGAGTTSPTPGSTRCPCSAPSRCGSAGRPKRCCAAPPAWAMAGCPTTARWSRPARPWTCCAAAWRNTAATRRASAWSRG